MVPSGRSVDKEPWWWNEENAGVSTEKAVHSSLRWQRLNRGFDEVMWG